MSLFSQIKAIKLLPHIHCLVHEIKHQGDQTMSAIRELIDNIRGDLSRKDAQLAELKEKLGHAGQVHAEQQARLDELAFHNEQMATELAATQAQLKEVADMNPEPATGGESAGGISE
jgi:chromosome segregation ATPase